MVAKSSITSLILTSFFSSTLANNSCTDKKICTGFGIEKLCKSSLFGAKMQKYCPQTCKVPCMQAIVLTENDNDDLADEIPSCVKLSKMCGEAEHKEFMGTYCAKTCAEKSSSDSEHSFRSSSSFNMVKSSCTDQKTSCPKMAMMCHMPMMAAICKKTCKIC